MASASSGNVATAAVCKVASGGNAEKPPASSLHLEPVAHEECVFLDAIGPQKFVLTNTLSLERASLPDGDWCIEYSEELGTSAVFEDVGEAEDDPMILVTEELLKRTVLRHTSGELFVEVAGSPASSLDDARCKYSEANIGVQAGPSAAKVQLQSFVFHLPRAGNQRMYWDLAQLHSICKMSSQKGVKAMWVAKGKLRWRAFLKQFCDIGYFVYSNHGNAKAEEAGEPISPTDRCLPSLCVCTVGLMLLLMRLSYASKQAGGLEDPVPRSAARGCFVAFMSLFANNQEPQVFRIELRERFAMRWPRPPLYDAVAVQLKLEGGVLNAEPLQALATARSKNQLAAGWWASIKSCMRDRAPIRVPFMKFVECCGVAKELTALVAQLMWQASVSLEKAFGQQSKSSSGSSMADGPLDISWKNRKEIFGEHLDLHLAEYTLASVQISHGHNCFFLATDKGSINSLPLQVSVVSLPTDHALVCVPQAARLASFCSSGALGREKIVSISKYPPGGDGDKNLGPIGRGFLSPPLLGNTFGPLSAEQPKKGQKPASSQVDYGFDTDPPATSGQKRKAANISEGSVLTERHRSWLQRGRDGVQKDSWRPRKLFRLAAKHWLAHTDCQLRHSTHVSGWSHFQMQDDELWSQSNWASWPWIGISLDQGSDGLSAAFALQNFYRCNCSLFFDFAHGARKDLQAALRACHMMDFILLYMISANLLHGPNKDDGRYHQTRACMREAYAKLDETTPLFSALAGAIHDEMRNSGHTWAGEASVEKEVWEHLKASDPMSKKGYQLNLNRFMGVVDVAASEVLPRWSTDLWERSYLALEMGWLHGAGIDKLVLRPGEAEAMTESHKPVSHAITLEDRSLRACLQNAVVISAMFLSDDMNKQRLQIFVSVSGDLRKWHGHQSHVLRSGGAAREFLIEQVAKGGWFNHVNAIASTPASEATLLDCGFAVPSSPSAAPRDNDQLLIDDELASLLGQYAFSLCIARQRRCLWLVASWPHKMYGILDEATSAQVCREFESDLAIFKDFSAFGEKVASDRAMAARHVMNLVACKQLAAGLEESRFEASEKLKSVVSQHAEGLISTQLIEDLIGVCKNDTECKGTSRYRRPQKAMGKCITSNTVETRHKYKPVPMGSSAIPKGSKLGKEAWQSKESNFSMRFSDIVSATPTAPYHSPAAHNACCRDADLQILRDARRSPKGYRSCRMSWLGELFDLDHRILFRKRNVQTGVQEFFVGGHHFPDSAVLAIRMQEVRVPGHSDCFYEPALISEPCLVSVFDLSSDEIVGCTYQWRSWLSQYLAYPGARESLKPAVRLFKIGDFAPMQKLAATMGFWKLSKSTIIKFSKYWGESIDNARSTFDVVLAAATALSGSSESEALSSCHHRLVNMRREAAFSQEVVQIDAAIQTFDINDHDEVNRRCQNASRTLSENEEFSKSFVMAKSLATERKKRKPNALKYPALPSTIPQAHARKFCPPGAHIWRCLGRCEWAGHLPPYARTSARWSEHTEEGAMKVVLRRLWNMFNEANGLPANTSPIAGLFPPALGEQSASSGQ